MREFQNYLNRSDYPEEIIVMNLDSSTYVYPHVSYQNYYDGLGVIGRHYFISDNITTIFFDASYNMSQGNREHLMDIMFTLLSCWPGRATVRIYVFTSAKIEQIYEG